ncbi:hypothetical protein Q6D67_01920 [Haliea sp. E1-2-M8]|uniref:hypothetical protein n=1 Tax=Haliea sp. E1-2-M8 TaxID=3064706 RepID=UPI00271FEDBC|nr:hypothetical protein [Haliea sp. E1-2-M8]MDO8860442.1 hypothetical protein [Haliea sp. E1-2-M8]
MNILLIILAGLGAGALVISVAIFTLAVRRYASDDDSDRATLFSDTGSEHRTRDDRRQASSPAEFPLTVNGVLITEDRRSRPDRRRSVRG